jgi:hypothetical protein
MSDNEKKAEKGEAAPATDTGATGGHMTGSAPCGNPRHAPLPDGSNRVPEDAKGYNPGSVVTG